MFKKKQPPQNNKAESSDDAQENMGHDSASVIKETTQEVLRLLDFNTEVSIDEQIDANDRKELTCNISTENDDSRFLIGQHGANLKALQSIISVVVYKKTQVFTPFTLDVNSYRAQKKERIMEIAQEAVRTVRAEKKPVSLPVMNAYDRRIAHMVAAQDDSVHTESLGEGENRHIIMKPKGVF